MMKVNKIGFCFSTKDRVELSKKSLESIDVDERIEIIWVDGSDTEEGRSLPLNYNFKKAKLIEVHSNIKNGPDAAIRFGLQRLLRRNYEYCGLIENDIKFTSVKWFDEIVNIFEKNTTTPEVGMITARTISSRVLGSYGDNALMWNIGAGMCALKNKCARLILSNYKLANAKDISGTVKKFFGKDLLDVWELWMGKDNRDLGCDWNFSPVLLRYGYLSVGLIPSIAINTDLDIRETSKAEYLANNINAKDDVVKCYQKDRRLYFIKKIMGLLDTWRYLNSHRKIWDTERKAIKYNAKEC